MLNEHNTVTVKLDLPKEEIRAGDVGAVVHCYDDRDAYEVELFDDHGRRRGVVTLLGEQLLKLNLVSLVA